MKQPMFLLRSSSVSWDREGEIVERFLKLFDVTSDRCHLSWLLVYEIHLQNRIVLILYDNHILLLSIGFKRSY